MPRLDLLASRPGRLLAFFLLYLTQGLPIGFCGGAVAVHLRRGALGVDEVGAFIAAVYAPWGVKWMAGPVLDLVGSRTLGHRRGWILLAQALMVVGLGVAGTLDPVTQLPAFTTAVVAVSAAAALQDVAIDALAVRTLPEAERGLGNGLMFAGAWIGQAIGGSGMLYVASATGGGLDAAYPLLAGIVALVWTLTLVGVREVHPPPALESVAQVARTAARYVLDTGRAMLGSGRSWATLALAFLPPGAMALGLALSATLAVELGLTDDDIATIGLIGALGGASGSVAGGWISDRLGHRRMLAVYVGLTLVPALALGWAMHSHGWVMPQTEPPDAPAPLVTTFWVASGAYGLASGLAYGTRMALFMGACAPEVAATQFTAYMAMMNLGTSVAAWWQGVAVERWGYPTTLAIDASVGLLCLLTLPFVGGAASHPGGRTPEAAGDGPSSSPAPVSTVARTSSARNGPVPQTEP